jgi:hypothetical protein
MAQQDIEKGVVDLGETSRAGQAARDIDAVGGPGQIAGETVGAEIEGKYKEPNAGGENRVKF